MPHTELIDPDKIYNPYMTARLLFAEEGLNERERGRMLDRLCARGIIDYARTPKGKTMGYWGADIVRYIRERQEARTTREMSGLLLAVEHLFEEMRRLSGLVAWSHAKPSGGYTIEYADKETIIRIPLEAPRGKNTTKGNHESKIHNPSRKRFVGRPQHRRSKDHNAPMPFLG